MEDVHWTDVRGPQNNLTQDQLGALEKWAIAQPLVEGMILFGSRAKGCAKYTSDVDIGIKLALPDTMETAEIYFAHEATWELDLKLLIELPVALALLLGSHTPNNSAYVRADGVAIFKRTPDSLVAYGY